jgi:hypothetical protein
MTLNKEKYKRALEIVTGEKQEMAINSYIKAWQFLIDCGAVYEVEGLERDAVALIEARLCRRGTTVRAV